MWTIMEAIIKDEGIIYFWFLRFDESKDHGF